MKRMLSAGVILLLSLVKAHCKNGNLACEDVFFTTSVNAINTMDIGSRIQVKAKESMQWKKLKAACSRHLKRPCKKAKKPFDCNQLYEMPVIKNVQPVSIGFPTVLVPVAQGTACALAC